MVAFPGGLQPLLSSGDWGEDGLLFGRWCRLPTEQETHFSVEREMSLNVASPGVHHQPDWATEPGFCRNGGSRHTQKGSNDAFVYGHGLATIQSHVSGFLNKVESSLRPCLSELAGRSLLRFQAAQGFLTGSRESARFAVSVVKHIREGPLRAAHCSLEVLPGGALSSPGLLKGEAATKVSALPLERLQAGDSKPLQELAAHLLDLGPPPLVQASERPEVPTAFFTLCPVTQSALLSQGC